MTAGPANPLPRQRRVASWRPPRLRHAASPAVIRPASRPGSPGAARGAAYRPDIDGLRAVAVLSVVLYHAGFSPISGGFVGVDIFFVISGYVISKSLLADLEGGRFSISGFYERRVRRIFPALFVTMILSTVAALVLLLPSYLLEFSKSLASSALFVSNFYFWKHSGYFENGANLRPLLHLWSLSVEEQFYVFAPLTLFVIHRFLQRRWALALAPVALASLALSVYATKVGPTANFFLLPTRAWELLIGALLALRPPPPLRSGAGGEVLALAGAGLIVWPLLAYSPATPFPGLAALAPCAGAAALIYVGSGPSSLTTRLLSLPPFVGVGLISYSLYLAHWPLVSFFTYCNLRPPRPAEGLLIVGASIILAVLSWRFVEQPFRTRRFAPPRPVLLAGGAAAMGLAAGLGGLVLAAHGLPGRFPRLADSPEARPPDPCFLVDDADPARWNPTTCIITHAGTAPALLWGDSFAAHYAPGVKAYAASIPYSVIEYAAAGCPPVLTYSAYDRPNCHRFNENALAIIRARGVKTVVLAARWVDLQQRGLAELRSTLSALSARA